MINIFRIIAFASLLFIASYTNHKAQQQFETGNVIFIHPDGTALSTYNATRAYYHGVDGELNWDRLSNIGLYQGYTKNSITASSQAGATIHAYGVKVKYDSYGMDGTDPVKSLSGFEGSIMQQAMQEGFFTGIINSGSIVEPGSGAFVASDVSRDNDEEIAKKIIESGADLIFSGGEEYLIPEGFEGRFGPGKRKDGLNLIDIATEKGYHIIYSREEIASIPSNTKRVLGVFEQGHTFNDKSEEKLKQLGLENYSPGAPTLAEMTDAAIKFLSAKGGNFFLVVEEEGTDNFGNKNNANATLEALKRADDAIGVSLDFLNSNPNTLIITAADSEAGGMEMYGYEISGIKIEEPLDEFSNNGAPQDGLDGTGTLPFLTAPDSDGNQFPFAISWSSHDDVCGSIVAKAEGLNAELMKGTVDNTIIYRIMYATLFGRWLE
ncbi:alkaline phosphatase [Bacteroidota bacterium]